MTSPAERTQCVATLEGPIAKGTKRIPTWRRQCRNLARPGKRYCHTHAAHEIREMRR